MYEDRLPSAHLRQAVQHLPGSNPIDDGRLGCVSRHAIWNRDEVSRGQDNIVGPGTNLRHRCDPLTNRHVYDVGAEALDNADQIITWHKGKYGLAGITATSH